MNNGKLYWATFEETINGRPRVMCLRTAGTGLERLTGIDKTEILNVPPVCVFHGLSETMATLNEYAAGLNDCGLIGLFKIQVHVYGC